MDVQPLEDATTGAIDGVQVSEEDKQDEWVRTQELYGEAALVEAENERLRRRLEEIEKELEETPDPAVTVVDGSRRLAALESSLAYLESVLSVLRENTPLPDEDPLLHRSDFLVDEQAYVSVQKTVEELEKTLQWEEARKEEEERNMQRDGTLLADAELLNGLLTKRVHRARADEQQPDGEVLVLRAQARLAHLNSQFAKLQSAMVQFVDEKLVEEEPPDEAGEAHGCEGGREKKRRKVEIFDLHRYIHADGPGEAAEKRAFQLKKLIEHLMNRAVQSPLDPWVSLSSLTPPPPEELVAFLLRARIARENPKDANKVRLVDFAAVSM
ncbi:hypothetical protein JCM10213_003459 [Rhodosporidiobolus nylandii]